MKRKTSIIACWIAAFLFTAAIILLTLNIILACVSG